MPCLCLISDYFMVTMQLMEMRVLRYWDTLDSQSWGGRRKLLNKEPVDEKDFLNHLPTIIATNEFQTMMLISVYDNITFASFYEDFHQVFHKAFWAWKSSQKPLIKIRIVLRFPYEKGCWS